MNTRDHECEVEDIEICSFCIYKDDRPEYLEFFKTTEVNRND